MTSTPGEAPSLSDTPATSGLRAVDPAASAAGTPEVSGAAVVDAAAAEQLRLAKRARKKRKRKRARKAARKEARLIAGAATAASTAAVATATAVPVTGGVTEQVMPARIRPRHRFALASLLLLVLLPWALATGYLYTRAANQYHSELAFSIRSEDAGSAAAGVLGALTQVSGGSASDADILFEYIRSQKIVEELDADLDLRAIYNRVPEDVIFSLGPDATIEKLHAHWNRMIEVDLDGTAGIIHLRANAFTPEDAQAISGAVLARSTALVNRLSDQARADALSFAGEELAEAEKNLRALRERMGEFRRQYNIVDPTADVAGQMGMLSALQQQLAGALVERDVLLSFASEGDQRVARANRRIDAITAQIEDERESLDMVGVGGSLPDLVGRYEELLVDLEFANTAYVQALAAVSAARAEARRQSRYLAAHIRPTLAESALYPRRVLLAGLTGLFLLLGWGVLMLVYYNVRDNR